MRAFLRKAKRAVLYGLWRSGFYAARRKMLHRRTLTVVMFHRVLPGDSKAYAESEQEYVVTPQEFEHSLRFLKAHYQVVSPADVEAANRGERALPDHAALITFDDGWRDNLTVAQPILKRLGLRATVFVNADAVRQQDHRWWQDALVEVVLHQPRRLEELVSGGGFYPSARALLSIPLEERLPRLQPWLRFSADERQMLSRDDLNALDPEVWDIGSHGTTHVPFTFARDLDEECTGSMKALSAWMGGRTVNTLAFPHGRYTPDILMRARAAGYELIFTSDVCVNSAEAGAIHTVGRVHLPGRACASDFALACELWRVPVGTP